MILLYGSMMCPDCRNCKLNFDKFGIKYEERDINESLRNLKEFLHYRDTRGDVFERLIKIGDIGIPCCVLGEDVFTDWEGYLRGLGYTDFIYEDTFKASCSITGKGC